MRLRAVAVLALVVLAVPGCGSSGGAIGRAASPTVTVFAASSLAQAFGRLGDGFEAAHPGVRVRFSFAGSQSLVAQIKQGAPAQVLATADAATMTSAGLAGARTFARNRLAIITAPGNPKRVTRLADLARGDLRVVLAGPTVPVGKAARTALAAAGISVRPVSLEQDVKGVVTKVRLGEADAGVAYATDVTAAHGAVAGIGLPGVSNSYLVAVVTDDPAARAFVDYVLSAPAQSVLASYGFLPPA